MSLVYSTNRLDEFEKVGSCVLIRLDEKIVNSGDDGEEQYQYYQTRVKVTGKLLRETIIEAIIRAKYPTYGAELAAQFNGGEELQEHQAWRALAKEKADYLIDNFFRITQGD